jgi:L-fuculose-phosphate aldolase
VPDAAALDRAADDLLHHCHALAAVGLVTAAAGNASVRVGPAVLLTGAGSRFGELERSDLVLVDQDGAVLDGTARPTSELRLHLDTYARRLDVDAVMHTHGRHAVALSTVATTVPVLHYYCVELGGPVPIAPYRTFGTPELAASTTAALGELGGVVMAHHGSLTVGADLARASARAELLEWLCEVSLLALAAGKPAELDAEQLDAVRAQIAARQATA